MDTPKLSLAEVADAVADDSDSWTHYIDRRTGQIVTVGEDVACEILADLGASASEIDELADLGHALDEFDPARFIRISGTGSRELPAMREFARSHPPGPKRDRLVDATYGRGLYRRFKDEAYRQGQIDAWYDYRLRYFAREARPWLRANDLPFVDDVTGAVRGAHEATDDDEQG